jgi:hypothetical protein
MYQLIIGDVRSLTNHSVNGLYPIELKEILQKEENIFLPGGSNLLARGVKSYNTSNNF